MACSPYLNGEIYCIHDIHFGIELSLLYKPENIINGIIKAGPIAEDRFASLKSEPVQNPMLLPTNDTANKANTKYKIKLYYILEID